MPRFYEQLITPPPWRGQGRLASRSERESLPFAASISFLLLELPGPRVQPVVPDPMPILTTDGEEVYKQEAWCWKTFLHEPGPLCSEYLESDAGSIGI